MLPVMIMLESVAGLDCDAGITLDTSTGFSAWFSSACAIL